jgi:hypothetical protein
MRCQVLPLYLWARLIAATRTPLAHTGEELFGATGEVRTWGGFTLHTVHTACLLLLSHEAVWFLTARAACVSAAGGAVGFPASALPASCLFVSTHYCCIDSTLGPSVCLLSGFCVRGQNSHDMRGTGVTGEAKGFVFATVSVLFSWPGDGALVHCLLLPYTQHDVATAVLLCCEANTLLVSAEVSCAGAGNESNHPLLHWAGLSISFGPSAAAPAPADSPAHRLAGWLVCLPPAAAGRRVLFRASYLLGTAACVLLVHAVDCLCY